MENVCQYYGHLVYFIAIWYILWQFGKFWLFGIFSPFWYVVQRKIRQRKIWQSCCRLEPREDELLPPLPQALERNVRIVKDGDSLGVQVQALQVSEVFVGITRRVSFAAGLCFVQLHGSLRT
jgi:hypothetical protein